ncbi:major facilitator superfamily domain-containing protein [Kockovaella imperatae]|uniref:Major facilitator superfamily domain-containing protein n=1 Tax=Kockovaella imperatae TaxID=4999 RepID=A0A1Y1UG57_9TREE|nr:major facilitator superfamily domain-containing protein [Kockovaella imperatae]ORX36494.1 major facilitator superfamily domain-containing protein [Kockovaella imperatae]
MSCSSRGTAVESRGAGDTLQRDQERPEVTPLPSESLIGFKPLVKSTTAQSAARDLENFETSSKNPRNWTNRKKWRITLTVALTGFISTCGSSIGVPGIHAIMAEYGQTNEKVGIFITTFYVLGLGCGPFLYAPISELYGRQVGYLLSLFPYILFSLGCAVAQSFWAVVILRFFCGVFGSCGPALGVATCADIFSPAERGRPVSIYAMGPMAGPVLGSMLGYWILYGGWRWLFYAITIMALINFILFLWLTEETYAPVLEKKLKYQVSHPFDIPASWCDQISPRTINHRLAWMRVMVSAEDAKDVFKKAFSRPPRLLFTNPVCIMFSLYYAYIYAIIYVFLVSVPLLYGREPFGQPNILFSYQFPDATLSLAYLGLMVGFLLAAAIAATAQDKIYKRLSKRAGDAKVGQPEYRLVLTQTGMCLLPIGLLIFAWTAEARLHWIAPQIGQVITLLGLTLAFNSIQNFIVDAFFPYSAAAIAAATACRSITACVLPEFTGEMFKKLGWGWGGTLLALVAAAGIPAPLIMFKWGQKLREKYRFDG